MKRKKFATLGLTLALACTLAIPAFASSVTETEISGTADETKTQEAQVLYEEPNRWTVSIPTNVNMANTDTNGVTQTLKATYSIQPGKQLNVKMKAREDGSTDNVGSDGTVILTRSNDSASSAATIQTTVKIGSNTVAPTSNIATATGTQTEKAAICTLTYTKPVRIDDAQKDIMAGVYTGKVTFEVSTSEKPAV